MHKLLARLLSISFAFTIVNAYDFQDPHFNEHLTDDLHELYYGNEFNFNVRNRRDASGDQEELCRKFPKPRMCCGDREFFKMLKADKKECLKEIMGEKRSSLPFDAFSCEKMEEIKRKLTCVEQCVGQKRGYIDSAGNVKESEFSKYVDDHATEDWFKSIKEGVISKCLDDSKEAPPQEANAYTCKPAAFNLHHCIFKEIQLRCPEDQIEDKNLCSKLREQLTSGKVFPLAGGSADNKD